MLIAEENGFELLSQNAGLEWQCSSKHFGFSKRFLIAACICYPSTPIAIKSIEKRFIAPVGYFVFH